MNLYPNILNAQPVRQTGLPAFEEIMSLSVTAATIVHLPCRPSRVLFRPVPAGTDVPPDRLVIATQGEAVMIGTAADVAGDPAGVIVGLFTRIETDR